ncbi:MAG: hypothetical protein EU540_00420 [Promethearchaeota archaeon]|nr:MAG: hypothetical protein EU540_00420 [Candidatus Lokiarchaeota archaeon]
MTYFKLIAGINCGIDKSVCQNGYPDNCFSCLAKKFSDAGFLIDIINVTEQHSEQKRKELLYLHIWKKYNDMVTIRHVLILTKGGIPALNMNIGDLPINAALISGFIQANISFSSQELTILDKFKLEKKLYEFDYKNFNVILYDGKLCRICLILDKKASKSLKELLIDFAGFFEDNYEDELKKVEELCDEDILEPAKKLIEQSFEINMNYPLILSSLIPPNIIENLSLVQKAIFECAKDLLKEDDYFFITYLMVKTSKLLGVVSDEEILWNIRQLMKNNIILSQDLEFQKEESETMVQEKQEMEDIFQKIKEKRDFEDIIFETHDMSIEDANIKISSLMKKAEITERNAAYQEALDEYQMALNYAREFNMKKRIDEISSKISEITKLNKEVELKFAMKQATKYELKKDYVVALKYLFQIKDIFIEENDDGKHDKQLQKIDHRIEKVQKHFKKNHDNI